jgi:molybdenum cofactor cytidylyltransferase
MAHDMSAGGLRLGALVLAAGAGSRFGGDKLVAPLEGRPVLQHVLDTLALVRPVVTVVVVAPRIDTLTGIAWRVEQRVVNPDPRRGLSSSLRVGIDVATATADLDGAFILLGDQPRTAASTLGALAAAARGAFAAGVIAVVPRYAEGGGANPVLLLRAGFSLVALATGDRGLGKLLAARSARVITVQIPGSNPDLDTPEDLRALESGSPG